MITQQIILSSRPTGLPTLENLKWKKLNYRPLEMEKYYWKVERRRYVDKVTEKQEQAYVKEYF